MAIVVGSSNSSSNSTDITGLPTAPNSPPTTDTTTFSANLTDTSVIVDDNIRINGSISVTSTAGPIRFSDAGNVDGMGGGAADDLTLSATAEVNIAGSIGATKPLRNFTVANAAAVTVGGTVSLTGNLTITQAATVVFGDAVNVAGNLTITNAGNVTFDGPVTVGGNLIIVQAGAVIFWAMSPPPAGWRSARPRPSARWRASTSTRARRSTSAAPARSSPAATSFSTTTSARARRPAGVATLGAGGAITFSANSILSLDATVPFVVTGGTNLTFGANVTTGNLVIGVGGTVSGAIDFRARPPPARWT